jgi:hypothetical protein
MNVEAANGLVLLAGADIVNIFLHGISRKIGNGICLDEIA